MIAPISKKVRVCKMCGITDDLVYFFKKRRKRRGKKYTQNICVPCFRQKDNEKATKYYHANREELIKKNRERYHRHKKRYNKIRRERHMKNKSSDIVQWYGTVNSSGYSTLTYQPLVMPIF